MSLSTGTTQALITFVLGGGVITLVTQLVRASRMWKSGRLATTREVIRDMAAARDEAEEREAEVRADKDYWRNIAGTYGYQLRASGRTPDPEWPQSPSEKRRVAERRSTRTVRQKRAEQAPTTQEIEQALGDSDDDLLR